MEAGSSSSASAAASGTANLACNTCGQSFLRKDDHRGHMKSEWHVYNLKRNIANLPPLSEMVFEERVKGLQIQDTTTVEDSSFFKTCLSCNKEFYNSKTWKVHVERSRCTRELELERTMESLELDAAKPEFGRDEIEDEDAASDPKGKSASGSFFPTKCLFCATNSPSLESNISHMHKIHGLFIPVQDYLIDISSLLSYFHAIINEFCECLYCGKDFSQGGAEAARMHMIGKGHCKFQMDEELEGFWDFDDDEDDGEGEDSTVEREANQSEIPIPEHDGSIRLPSGKTLGHRSKAHIYRQNMQHYQGTPEERLAKRKLALEELKAANLATATKEPDQAFEGAEPMESDDAADSKEKVSMAISTLVNSRVRGLNTGQVIRRTTDQTALAGLSEVERRAVVARERKLMKTELRAKNQMNWKVAKKGNEQGTFKPDVPGPMNG